MTTISWGSRYIVGTSEGGALHLINRSTFQIFRTIQAHKSQILTVTMLDSDTIATAGRDRLIRIWDLSTQEQITTVSGNKASVVSLASTPNGGRIFSSSLDNAIRVFERIGKTAVD
jgi:WD40 repeat protein